MKEKVSQKQENAEARAAVPQDKSRIWLNPQELVEHFQNRVSKKTLANWRYRHKGPEWIRFGGRILYALEDIERWEQRCRGI